MDVVAEPVAMTEIGLMDRARRALKIPEAAVYMREQLFERVMNLRGVPVCWDASPDRFPICVATFMPDPHISPTPVGMY